MKCTYTDTQTSQNIHYHTLLHLPSAHKHELYTQMGSQILLLHKNAIFKENKCVKILKKHAHITHIVYEININRYTNLLNIHYHT